jgi:hypothetical protein
MRPIGLPSWSVTVAVVVPPWCWTLLERGPDDNGVVNVMWVVDDGAWAGPVGLTPLGTAAPGAPLATARQTDQQIDVFFADDNGTVNVMWVVDTGTWQGPVVI